MPQQNKRPEWTAAGKKLQDLESKLMEDDFQDGNEKDIGRAVHHGTDTSGDDMVHSKAQFMYVKQGLRARHPERVLHQFEAVKATTERVDSVWEKNLMDENDRVTMPMEYNVAGEDSSMIATQLGMVSTALQNYKSSKEKLVRASIMNV